MPMVDSWIAERTKNFDSSGIRRMFELAAKLKDPIDLSIGQPNFDVPPPVKDAMIRAINDGHNGYAPTQGVSVLREKLQDSINRQLGHDDRQVFVCSGTSGGLVLSALSLVNQGDEVIFFDPYFVMYPALIELAGGVPVKISTYPDFQIDVDKLQAAITDRTKMIIVNSPSNPTGVCTSREAIRGVAELAARHGICLVSDEIYSRFNYDAPQISPAEFNPDTIVIDGFSKSYAMTGWRVGYVHGPAHIIDTMIKLQQFTFVCAPHPAQLACETAMDTDISSYVADYKSKRDTMFDALKDHYTIVKPGGAFYLFPQVPWGDSQQFVEKAIEHNMLVIPGNIFSEQETHFRISYAVDDRTLHRGIDGLKELAALH